ncbi:3-dehydroquinate synthase [Salisediminibacterium halotolerans]|uniref:3-dehydroquinate synthase n=1 Tax=Salisediminibacterium halotolerans TaxID=517425 RepID=A0A1H9P455_9BACI|nr:3-dehydroquinate synthase [Salisediminibacterium haloalkalitolerans]SER42373.1 3-dehydroquinate synthase [Salisediminibacterium haloalkalitolerans]
MAERALEIRSESHTYPIYIAAGLRHQTADILKGLGKSTFSAVLIVTDETVGPLYAEEVAASFADEQPLYICTLAAGEQSKSMETYYELMTFALNCHLDRNSVIVALGGGVVGDAAGFAAATYMRGIDYVQMPTTLLAHDSSVGGKTGINHPLGKNLIGAFHPPAAVIYDTETLYTLPEKEWRSGLAEVIKHGWIQDPELLKVIKDQWLDLSAVPVDVLNDTIRQSIQVKAEIVQLDEREAGIRAFLNFGHTLGHAIEAEAGYGTLTHGEAVAIGMDFAMKLSGKVLGSSLDSEAYNEEMIRLGYDLTIPASCEPETLLAHMKRDKKAAEQKVRFVLLQEAGVPLVRPVEDDTILDLLKEEMTI